jgi:hypothetical protein
MMRAMGLVGAAAFMLAAGAARADGLADMKAALARASGTAPIKALVETRTWRKLGEGAQAEEERGAASITVEDGARGLSVAHSKEMVTRMDAELRARSKNPNSKTPILSALEEIGPRDVLALTSAAASLVRTIERGQFKGERADSYQGKSARVLTFDMPISTLSTRDRKYAKTFTSVLDVWIGADGMPLASRLRQAMSGRAFVVVTFEARQDEDSVYSLVGDRLLAVHKEARSHAAGAGERDERKVVTALSIQL